MENVVTHPPDESSILLRKAADGDQAALGELFARYHERLRRTVRLRLSRRLQGRVDGSDILQEAYVEAARQLPDYLRDPPLPFHLWLRQILGRKLIDVHRRHLGARMRDAAHEVSLHSGGLPEASSLMLAAHLLGRLTSPSQAAVKAETRLRIQEALNRMDPLDREILALRHFEQLKNLEVAQVLEIDASTASTRHLRALKRLKDELGNIPGLFGH
jgi:RNA polymerase sigma-70 factor (ECF subfamily)